jgi:phage terminase large subunit
MAFQDTTATKKIFSLRKKIRAVSGGTGASKTISILVWIIDYGQSTKNKIVTIVAESFPHMQVGVIRDFKRIMQENGYWEQSRWNETQHFYTFSDGTIVEFISFDKFGKAHGPRRNVLFLNEANNIPWIIADQLITRTSEVVWLDWNPSSEFWFYTEILGRRNDVDFLGVGGNYPPLTYLDNEALDESQKAEILAHQNNKNWWRVYGLGQLGEVEGRIYGGWQICEDIPHEARLERKGLDFGYTNDPTAIVDIYYFNGGYILDETTFQKGLSNKQIADLLLNQQRALVVADSNEPKSIDEIRSFGISIIPAVKGKDSVRQGIQVVQDQRISVTKRSVNIIKEYRNYLWQTDRDGRNLNEPEHPWSHSMDAIRYAMTSLIPVIRRREQKDYLQELGRRQWQMKNNVNPAL